MYYVVRSPDLEGAPFVKLTMGRQVSKPSFRRACTFEPKQLPLTELPNWRNYTMYLIPIILYQYIHVPRMSV